MLKFSYHERGLLMNSRGLEFSKEQLGVKKCFERTGL